MDYDLKIYSLSDRDARKFIDRKTSFNSCGNPRPQPLSLLAGKVSENATKKAPATHSGPFKAVMMSTGGLVSRETADEIRKWRREMGPMIFKGMVKKTSSELRARAKTFAM